MDKNRKNIIFIICGIFFITLIFIVIHPSTRQFIKKVTEIRSLEKQIEKATIENNEYSKSLLYLQTIPEQLDKAVKLSLEVIAEDEMEYIFVNDNKEDLKQ